MSDNKEILEINIEDIIPNRFQPRLTFDMEALNELANSIKIHGIIQPLVVRKIQDKYEIIAGERRYKAATIIGLKKVPCIVMNLNDNESAEVAIVENIQRKEMTPLEEAKSFKLLLDKGYLTQDELAKKMGKSQSSIANKLRLLNLDEMVQDAILNGKISERHARSLLKINEKEKQRDILTEIIDKRLTVKQTDDLIKEKYEVNNMDNENIINSNTEFNKNNNFMSSENISRPEVNIPINNVTNDVNPQLNLISNLGRINQQPANSIVTNEIEIKTDENFDESKNQSLNIFRDSFLPKDEITPDINLPSQIENNFNLGTNNLSYLQNKDNDNNSNINSLLNSNNKEFVEPNSLNINDNLNNGINNLLNPNVFSSQNSNNIKEEKNTFKEPNNNFNINYEKEESSLNINNNLNNGINNLLNPNVFEKPNNLPPQNFSSNLDNNNSRTDNLINLSELTNSKKEEPEKIEELLFDTNESITIVSNFIKNFASKIDSEISNFKSTGINIIKEEKDLGNKYEITIIIDK